MARHEVYPGSPAYAEDFNLLRARVLGHNHGDPDEAKLGGASFAPYSFRLTTCMAPRTVRFFSPALLGCLGGTPHIIGWSGGTECLPGYWGVSLPGGTTSVATGIFMPPWPMVQNKFTVRPVVVPFDVPGSNYRLILSVSYYPVTGYPISTVSTNWRTVTAQYEGEQHLTYSPAQALFQEFFVVHGEVTASGGMCSWLVGRDGLHPEDSGLELAVQGVFVEWTGW